MATKDKSTLREHWERAGPDWVRWARTPGHDYWYANLNLPAFLELLPAPRGWTLDLACGEGRLTRELHQRGHRIAGLDASLPAVRAFREVGAEPPIVRGDAARLPFRDGAFKLVIAFMSLFNLDEMQAALHEVARVLEPGGRLCFAVLHPIFSAGRFESKEADAPFTINGSYAKPRSLFTVVERDGIKMEFHDEHRPFSFYFGALAAAGFLVESLAEPLPDAEFARRPGVAQHQRVPLYLHVRAWTPG